MRLRASWRPPWWSAALTAAVMLAGACTGGSSGGTALVAAEAAARGQVSGWSGTFADILKTAPSGARAVADMTATATADGIGSSTRTYLTASSAEPGAGAASVTLSVYGLGEGAQGGDSFHQAWVVLCVQLLGRVSPDDPGVSVSQVSCPATAPPGAPAAERTLAP